MNSARGWVILRLAALLALAASAALWVDYFGGAGTFCAVDSGCAKVKASGFPLLGGTKNLPIIGLVGFGSLLAASLFTASTFARMLARYGAYLGGVGALWFIGRQIQINHFCWLCLIADTSALAAAGGAFLAGRDSEAEEAALGLETWAWLGLALVALAGPYGWSKLRPQPSVPPVIQALYVPGKINVVEFFDFQCPHCRRLYPVIQKVKKDYGDEVNFVPMNYPLGSHSHAQGAARAFLCAGKQGKGPEMAAALFSSDDLTSGATRRHAVGLGLDPTEFDSCRVAAETDAEIERQKKVLQDAGMLGLPTTYVGSTRILGTPRDADAQFRQAFDAAKRGEEGGGVPGWLFGLGVLIAVAGVGFLGRTTPGDES